MTRDSKPAALRRSPLARGVLLLSLCWICACSGGRAARETIDAFLDAVQSADADALFCLMTGAAASEELGADPRARREAFGDWLHGQLEAYELGRDEGFVELDGNGVRAVKLFALGKGTFYELGPVERAAPDALRVRMEMRFGYSALDLSGFSPGTTLYLCGVPPGRVHGIRVPRGSGEESAQVLERLSLEWTLVRATESEGCRNQWTVGSVRAIEETASATRITWAF